MERVSVSAVSLESLEQDLGVTDLKEYLDAVGVPIYTDGGRSLVLEAPLNRHLGDLIRREMTARQENGAHWSERRRAMLGRNPRVGQLIEQFIEYLGEQAQDIIVQRNAYTITIKLPDGGWAGLKPRAWGALLYATRSGEKREFKISTARDLDAALSWLRGLPGYSA